VADKFNKAFAEAFKQYKIGKPLDPATTHGPQADSIQFKRVKEFLQLAKQGKGKIELGGDAIKAESGNGFFIEPTVRLPLHVLRCLVDANTQLSDRS
jgi:aldehyde dehydrogenase (NAD+)